MLPVVGFINSGSPEALARNLAAFRAGLAENDFSEGRNVAIEYHWLGDQYDPLPALVSDIVRRHVSVIAAPGTQVAAVAAKAATNTIPIVFGVGEDPVKLGLVASLARPGGNATGMNFFFNETVSKRMGLLHELVPKADRVAVLVHPAASATTVQETQSAAQRTGLTIVVVKAGNSAEIEEAFATLGREGIKALFIQANGYFASRAIQIATFSARYGIATSAVTRQFPEAGGLTSYGPDIAEVYHQVGVYTGLILKGAKPADLPVVQSTRFHFIINMQTARALGLQVPPKLLAIADEVIE
jgi:putative ABC transport system substrate-binding protein